MRFHVLLAIASSMGCVGDLETDPGPVPDPDPSEGAAIARTMFEETVYPTLEQKCGDCHDSMAPSGNVTGFVNRDKAKAYATATGYTALVGNFAAGSAPILLKIAAGHQQRTYSTAEIAAITAWLDKEIVVRGADSGSGGEGPSEVTARLLAQWSGCMTLANFNAATMAVAWGTLTTDDGRQCQNCHVNGAEGFIATTESTKLFDVISSNKQYMLQYFTVDLKDLATAKIIVNTAPFLAVSQGKDPHREHPQFDALKNQGMVALGVFYDATMNAKAAAGPSCGPSKLTN